MHKIAVITVALLISAASASFWTPCGGSATTHHVTSNVCDDSGCQVVRGQQFIANTTISFTGAHSRLEIRVRSVWLGITINLPLSPPDDDACNGLFRDGVPASCPTVPNVRYQWVMVNDIPATIPAIQNTRVYSEF